MERCSVRQRIILWGLARNWMLELHGMDPRGTKRRDRIRKVEATRGSEQLNRPLTVWFHYYLRRSRSRFESGEPLSEERMNAAMI